MPKPASTVKTKRVQFDFLEPSLARLQRLKENREAASYSEVVKQALKLYEFVVDQELAGATVYIKTPEGEVRNVMML